MKNKEFFDLYWQKKELRKLDDLRHLLLPLKKEAHSLLNHQSPKLILEIGPGMGEDTRILVDHGHDVVAIDFSRESLYKVRNQISNFKFQISNKSRFLVSSFQTNFQSPVTNFHLLQMDAHHLGFKDESFDLLFGNTVLLHLDRKRFFREAQRVLKKGGKAVYIEPLKDSPFLFFYRMLLSASRRIHPRYLSLREIQFLSSYFQEVKALPFYLMSLLFLPLLPTKLSFIHHFFFSMDKTLLHLFPFIKRFSSFTVIECVK